MNEKEKYVEQSTGAEIVCHSMEDLEFYVAESTKLIERKHEELLKISADKPLYVIKRKNVDLDNEEDLEVVLIYDCYYVLFSSEEEATKFMDSFMDIGMKLQVEIVRIQDYGELMHRLPISMLGDGLIIKRVEFKSDDDVWHCEDLIYDPATNIESK